MDIILLDNKLPGMQGIDIMPYLNEHYPDTKILIITSFASLDIALEATKHGALISFPNLYSTGTKNAIEIASKQIYLNSIIKIWIKKLEKYASNFFLFCRMSSKPHNYPRRIYLYDKEKQLGDNIDNYMELIDKMLNKLEEMRTLIMDLLDFTNLQAESTIGEKNCYH